MPDRALVDRLAQMRPALCSRLPRDQASFAPYRRVPSVSVDPLARAERHPAAIAAWLETTYPAIARRAKAMRAVIYGGDETGISNQDPIGRSYAPKGQTPVMPRTARRISRSMISAVSNRGLLRFMLDGGALNAAGFIAFLRRLIKDAGQKVILIVDNLKVHKAGKVMVWVESHAQEIELCYLPSYAPDHNPSEYLNNELKQQLRQQPQASGSDLTLDTRSAPAVVAPDAESGRPSGADQAGTKCQNWTTSSPQELSERTRSVLRAIQRSPKRVQAYFRPEPVRYAARSVRYNGVSLVMP
jgi:transposase